jgi:hypothetical protein
MNWRICLVAAIASVCSLIVACRFEQGQPDGNVVGVGVPTAVTARPGDKQIAVAWTAAAATGEPVESYTASARAIGNGSALGSCDSSSTSCTIDGLTNGVTYAVTVVAHARDGDGSASNPPVDAMPIPAALDSSSLVLWLDATQLNIAVGSAFATWPDRSATANDATQTVGGDQPRFDNAVGLSAVTFDGNADFMTTMEPVIHASSAYTILVTYVGRDTAVVPDRAPALYATRNCGAAGGPGFDAWVYNSFGSNQTVPVPGGESPDAIGDQISINGAAFIAVPDGGGGGPTTAVPFGTWTLLTQQLTTSAQTQPGMLFLGRTQDTCVGSETNAHASIGELLVFSTLLGSDDLGDVEGYLGQRWGVPIP